MTAPQQHGTGALFRFRGIKDFHLEHEPGVSAQLQTALPSPFNVLPLEKIEAKYDQGTLSACTCASEATAKSIQDFGDIGRWQIYDWLEAYHYLGGTGSNGLPTDATLAYCRDTGLLLVRSQSRWPIESYLFAPEVPGEWRRTLAAALVATGPCVIATLLPSSFGWDSNTEIPQSPGYHQMCLVGYDGLGDDDHAIFLNTWGSYMGRNGFYRLTWAYLEGNNFQNGYCYGYQMTDHHEAIVPPDPTPTPLTVTGFAEKANANIIRITPDTDATKLKGKRVTIQEIVK